MDQQPAGSLSFVVLVSPWASKLKTGQVHQVLCFENEHSVLRLAGVAISLEKHIYQEFARV